MQSASRQAVKSCSEAVGLRVVQARSGGRTCRGKNGCRVSRVDFAHGWAKSFTRVATLRSLELLFPEKAPTFLAILRSSVMFLMIIVEMAKAIASVRELAITSPARGEVRRAAANP